MSLPRARQLALSPSLRPARPSSPRPRHPGLRAAAQLLIGLFAVGVVAAAAGCKQAVRPPTVLSAWRDDQARYFDDGIDFETGKVVRLRGKWSTAEEELFQNRLGLADVVAVGKIRFSTA